MYISSWDVHIYTYVSHVFWQAHKTRGWLNEGPLPPLFGFVLLEKKRFWPLTGKPSIIIYLLHVERNPSIHQSTNRKRKSVIQTVVLKSACLAMPMSLCCRPRWRRRRARHVPDLQTPNIATADTAETNIALRNHAVKWPWPWVITGDFTGIIKFYINGVGF